jgi:hypothetical protein
MEILSGFVVGVVLLLIEHWVVQPARKSFEDSNSANKSGSLLLSVLMVPFVMSIALFIAFVVLAAFVYFRGVISFERLSLDMSIVKLLFGNASLTFAGVFYVVIISVVSYLFFDPSKLVTYLSVGMLSMFLIDLWVISFFGDLWWVLLLVLTLSNIWFLFCTILLVADSLDRGKLYILPIFIFPLNALAAIFFVHIQPHFSWLGSLLWLVVEYFIIKWCFDAHGEPRWYTPRDRLYIPRDRRR